MEMSLLACCFFLVITVNPRLEFSSAAHPKGHLEPLGFHRAADYDIAEFSDPAAVSPKQFFEQYVVGGRPVVYRGAAKEFDAFTKWTVDNLNTSYGQLEMRVEHVAPTKTYHGQAEGDFGLGRESISGFLSKLSAPVSHIVSELPTPMYPDISLLPSVSCGTLSQRVVRVLLNMGTGGMSSGLGQRSLHAMHCQLNGSQDWILISRNESANLYLKPEQAARGRVPSAINADSVDMEKFPLFTGVPWGLISLKAGDCLFIPAHHPYHVRSYGMLNIDVTLLFSDIDPSLAFDESSCKEGKSEFARLDTVKENILWPYPGTGLLSLTRPDDVTMIEKIKSLSKDAHPSKKDFLQLIEDDNTQSQEYKERKEEVEKAFDLLKQSKSVSEVLTDEDLSLVSNAQWREVSYLLFPEEDLSMSPDFEYGILSFNLIRVIIARALVSNERLDRETFVEVYHKILQGSAFFGNKLFDQLDTNKNGIITTKLLRKNRLDKGLKEFLQTGEETETEEDVENTSYLMSLLVGDEESVEKDSKLLPTEKDSALDLIRERYQLVQTLVGMDEGGDDSEEEEDEEEEEGDDPEYREHLKRIEREKLAEEYEFDPEGLKKALEEDSEDAKTFRTIDQGDDKATSEGEKRGAKESEQKENSRDEL